MSPLGRQKLRRGRWTKVGEVGTGITANLLIAEPAHIAGDLGDQRWLPPYDELMGLKYSPLVSVTLRPKNYPNEWLVIQARDTVHKQPNAVVVNTGAEAGYDVYARIVQVDGMERIAEIKIKFIEDDELQEDSELTPQQVDSAVERESRFHKANRVQ